MRPLTQQTLEYPTIQPFTGWSALRESSWAYPALEGVHLLGVALLLGNLVLFELRVLGIGNKIELRALARMALPLALLGFALAAGAGLSMFASQPLELLENPAFRWKMLLIFAAGGNAAWFHARGALSKHDTLARLQALASLALWLAVLGCGRAIEYLK